MSHFQFFGLIPELRISVYEEVLTHDFAVGRKATVALLRTCHQIYDEAKGILYTTSTLNIDSKCDSRTRYFAAVGGPMWTPNTPHAEDYHPER